MAGAVMGGLALANAVVKGRKKRKEAKKAKKARDKQAQLVQQMASPETYMANLNNYRQQFAEGYKPALRSVGDQLGLGEANAMSGFNSDVARRGLSGSGMAFAGQNSIRSARMTGLGDAMRQYQMDVEQSARSQAGDSQHTALQGQYLQPRYQYMPSGPSPLENVLGGAEEGMGAMGGMAGMMGSNPSSFAGLMGFNGGAPAGGAAGPPAPYYVGNNVGRG